MEGLDSFVRAVVTSGEAILGAVKWDLILSYHVKNEVVDGGERKDAEGTWSNVRCC